MGIDDVIGNAIAVDPLTGHIWVLEGGQLGEGKTIVYDDQGMKIASHDISGWDIVYDPKDKAFWIAERKLTKIAAATGKVAFTIDVSTFSASSMDVDQNSGAVWVAVREHGQIGGSRNRLLKFDANGQKLAAIELGKKLPFRVSIDPSDGSVWVANMMKSVERFSADGKSQAEFSVEALAVQVDPSGGDIWVATPTDVRKMSRTGDVTIRVHHVGKTTQAWITSLE